MARKKKVQNNVAPWLYKGQELVDMPEDILANQYGFIYLITNKLDGYQYIGKKNLFKYKTQVSHVLNERTGRMNKVKEVVKAGESDWRTYFGSSAEIKEAVARDGKDNFIREILYFVPSKKQLTYFEAKELFSRGVIEPNSKFYNSNILAKFYGSDFKL
jgi:hypothetical protein